MQIKPNLPWQKWLIVHSWIPEAILSLLLLFFLNFLLKRFLIRIKQKAHLKENDWRTQIDSAVFSPAKVLYVILLGSFLVHLGSEEFGYQILLPYIAFLRNTGIVLCISWFLLRWKKLFHNAMASRRFKGKPYFDPVSLEIIGKVFTAAVIFVSLLIILGLFGLDILPLVTFGGIGAAALGFASRDCLANFFGGLMLYVTRPFTVGDLIEIQGKSVTGQVEQIGWYLTTIRDPQKKPIYVPNSVFSGECLFNLSRITHRTIQETIRIRYMDISKIQIIIGEIRHLLENHPEMDFDQPVHVYLSAFGPFSIELEVKAYTLSTRYEEFMEIKQKILLGLASIVTKSGAEMYQHHYASEIF